MTPQNVIKSFIDRLANHGYTSLDSVNMLDSAVRASSRFTNINEVIYSIQADQLKAEQLAIQTVVNYYCSEEVFYNYCVENGSIKPLSEISSDLLDFPCGDGSITVGELIKETSSLLFLKNYCGIDLNNEDTGAISGSDANLVLTAAELGSNGERSLQILSERYGNEASLSADGQTLIIGTGITKTSEDVVPENFNTYTADADTAQKIETGTKGWVVNGTANKDTITSNGADYIDAGAGNDIIIANADGATITSGKGNDKIAIAAKVKTINFTDLSNKDELTIFGDFEVGAATVEDMMLTITDKTGTRKITLAQFQADTKIKIGDLSTTLGKWLADKADWDWSTYTEPSATASSSKATVDVNLDSITADDIGNAWLDGDIIGELSNSYPNVSTFTKNGLTIHLRGTADNIALTNTEPITFDELNDDQRTIIAGLFKWWTEEALNLNEESYGLKFDDKASVHDVDLYFFNDENGSLAAILPSARSDFDGVATALCLSINLEPYQKISPDNVNGESAEWGYLDRTLAHELNHAVFNANINFFSTLPTFIKEGFADLTHGVDDDLQQAIMRVTRDADKLVAELDVTNNTTQGVTTDTYAAGYIFLRYYAKQAALQTLVFPAFGKIETVSIDFNNLDVEAGNILYINTSTATPTIQVAQDITTFENLDDDDNVLYAVGEISDLGDGTLYYSIYSDLFKQNIKLGGAITNVYQLNANTNLTGTDGDDAIQLVEGANSIKGGSGNDYLEVNGQYATINTGAGDDIVFLLDGGHNSINLGDGDNYLELDGEPFADYSYTYSYLYNNSITAGAGNDTIVNPTTRYFDSYGEEVTADTDGAILYEFFGYHFNSNIDLGDGNNQISLTSVVNSSVKTGKDTDIIAITVSKNSTIDAGAGDDIIKFYGSGNVIDAGAGENIIMNEGGSANTIRTSAGSDIISLNSAVKEFTVEGFGEGDVIELADAPYELEIEDDKLVAGDVTIAGINSFATVDTVWSTASNQITYKQATLGGAYLEGSYISYAESGSETIFSITGLKDTVGVELDGYDVILTEEALENRTANTITISNDEYTLRIDGAEDGTLTLTEGTEATFEDGTYTAAITAEFFAEEEGAIVYHKTTGGQQFKIEGLNEDAALDEDIFVGEDGTVTVKASALPDTVEEGAKVKLTDSKSGDGVTYTLTFDEEITQDTSAQKGGWSGENGSFTFTEDYKPAGWQKDKNTYTFHNQTGGHKFTVSGLKDDVTADNFTSKTVKITGDATKGYTVKILSESLLPTAGEVSIEGIEGIDDLEAPECKLELDSKITKPKEIAESFKEKSGKYTYTAAGNTAGWSLEDDKIIYSEAKGGEQFELSGIKSNVKLNSGVTVADGVVKVSASALNTSAKDGTTIILTDSDNNYTLQLDDEILQAATTVEGAFTNISNGKATYTATHNLSYYEQIATNAYTYHKYDAAKKITIGNLKTTATTNDLDAITITEEGDNKFTVKINDAKILNSKAPSISADKGVTYTVEVADDLNPVLLDADWLVKSTNASLKADTSAGYVVKNNKVVYSGKQTGKAQIILSGVDTNANLAVPVEGVITLNATDLGTNAYIKANAINCAFELTGDMKGKKFSGTSANDTLKISASNASIYGGTGDDEFNITGDAVTVTGGKGNDNYSISGNDAVFVYSKGDGLDTVNYAQGLKVSLGGTLNPLNVVQNENDVIINLGKNDSITVTNVGDTLEILNKNSSQTIAKNRLPIEENLTFDAKGNAVTVGSAFTGTISSDDDVYMSNGKFSKVSTIDASAITGEALIIGNAKSNTIIGGKSKTSLTGDKGNDTFIYNGGELTITDYGNGKDRISLGSYTYESFAIDGSDVVISFGNNNSLRLEDGAGKAVTFVEGKNTTVNIYTAEGIYNSGKTAVTLTSSTGDLSKESKIATITAGASFEGVEIIGNAKVNIINGGIKGESLLGGAGNDQLIGNGGVDTLWGGESNDLFVFDGKGADVIMDYGVGTDKVSLDVDMAITDVDVIDKDVILKFTNGDPLKFVGVGDKKISIVETSINAKGKKVGKTSTFIFEDDKIFNSGKTAVTLTGAAGNISTESKIITIMAGANFNGAEIVGNDKANIIIGSDEGESLLGGKGNDKLIGNDGADTLWGNAGNDVLTGGDGIDTFIYKPGEGDDTITDYESGELLTIIDSTFKTASFINGTLTLKIDGGGLIRLKNVNESTAFNINGTTYKVDGKTIA